MTALLPSEIELLRDSLRQIRPFAQEVGALFFLRLCELDPSMRTRLPDTVGEQSARVFALIEETVGCADTPDRLSALALKFSAANRRLDLGAKQHAAIRQALLWALERSATGGFSAPARRAWDHFGEMLSAKIGGAASGVAAA